ncbi:MAG: hypothetical protein CVV05_00440 [Gammaproteobacteria bacterium HGW-Gammaproteobacteria-1]|jgi:hypothetical protein|nr:MAG: hypothetical protein CVV05_00440 [Gammaproteobacteria bacterium HGW-Gammaproteobacteria-1]
MKHVDTLIQRSHNALLSRLLTLYREPVEYFRALPFTILGLNVDYPDRTALLSVKRPPNEQLLVGVLAVAKGRIHEAQGDTCVVADLVDDDVLVCHLFTMVGEQLYWYSHAYRVVPTADNPAVITRLTEVEEARYEQALQLPPLYTQLLATFSEGDARNFAQLNEHPYMNMVFKYANIPLSVRLS